MNRLWLTVGVVLVFLGGCSGAARSPAGPPADVAGAWTGLTTTAVNVSLTLTQTGSTVAGLIDVGGRPDLSGPVTGTVSGNTVRIELMGRVASTGLLNASGDTIGGEFAGQRLSLRRSPR